jgi:hypothetical protein
MSNGPSCDKCKNQRWIQHGHSWQKDRAASDLRPFQQALWWALGAPLISVLRATKCLVPCECNPSSFAPWAKDQGSDSTVRPASGSPF